MQKQLLLLFVISACGDLSHAVETHAEESTDAGSDACDHAALQALRFAEAPLAGGSKGTAPSVVVLGDLNADQRPDVVFEHSVSINTTATGASSTTFVTTDLDDLNGFAVADFDGDALPDLAAVRTPSSGPRYLSILPNRTTPGVTDASFAAAVDVTTWPDAELVAKVADLNADGKPDFVLGSISSTVVTVLMNTTTGSTLTFAAPTDVSLPGTLLGLEVADLSGDGAPDLVVPTASSDTDYSITVLVDTTTTGTSAPTFDTKILGSFPSTAGWIATGDLNGDGAIDVALSDAIASIWVFLNASLSPTTPIVLSRDVGSGIAIGDINGDGALDIMSNDYDVQFDQFHGRVTSYVSTTCGATTVFGQGIPSERFYGHVPGTIALSDLNMDGRLDAIVSTGGTGGTFATQLLAY